MNSKSCVLCVDDEPNLLRSYQRALRNEPYNILLASNGKEALEILKSNNVNVVITDFRMAGMNGIELLHEVRKNYPKMICAILSGYADEATVQKALQTGEISTFLLKPINNEQLKNEIQRLLSKVSTE